MEKITINKLGPIEHCEINLKDFLVFTGSQASGKSTISKSIFFFKNVKNLMYQQTQKRAFRTDESMRLSIKNSLIKQLRSVFLQTFGSTWHMDKSMSVVYHYTESDYISVGLIDDLINPNYIWIELSKGFVELMDRFDALSDDVFLQMLHDGSIKRDIDEFFKDDTEIIYIPAGRSMMTLLSSQIMYLYSVMNDDQKRSLDYCTQNYLERIMQLKPAFSYSAVSQIKSKMELTDVIIDKENLFQCAELMKTILQGEYRNVDGEERLQVASDRYVKINYASSGQQEAVWILNVLFYYMLNNKKSYFIIEEPESHLFPNAQKLMAEFISLAKNGGNKVLLTTHSPYILGTINNLLYANKISREVDHHALSSIIHPNKWLKYEKLDAYYLENGCVQSCMDQELEAIDNSVIDDASDDINGDFDRMVALKHGQDTEDE